MATSETHFNLVHFAPRRLFIVSLLLMLNIFTSKSFAAPPAGYNLIWSDEFNETVGGAPSTFWNFDQGDGGWGNSELENYTNSTVNSQIVSDPNATDGKALAIITIDTTPGSGNYSPPGGRYTSARLTTAGNFSFQYGYIEANIQLPYGQGIWPGFWMLGNDFYTGAPNDFVESGNWPACGEVDIMESICNTSTSPIGESWESTIDEALHMPGHYGSNPLISYWGLSGGQLYHNAYHLFAAEWLPGQIQFFVDGNLVATRNSNDVSQGQWPYDSGPFFMLLNVAVGSSSSYPGAPNGGTSFPQTMLVDYVRVYQTTITPTPSASTTATAGPPPLAPILYPNPVTGSAPITLHITGGQTGQPYNLKVFTLAFRKIIEVDNLSTDVAFNPADSTGTALANGLYYVVVQQGSNQGIAKLLVLR